MIAGQVAKFNSVLRKAYSHVLLEQMERTFDQTALSLHYISNIISELLRQHVNRPLWMSGR